MGSTGATLSGSYSGASATPSAVGFKWGTSSGNLTETLSATNSNGSFSAILSGRQANTTYYYKAFVTVSGTGDHASESETFYGDVCSFTTGATSTVTTGSASDKTSSSATLSASYANIVTGTKAPQAIWFAYGTSSGNLNQTAYGDNSTVTSASGSFSINVEGLAPSTTYYYKAYMTVWNGSTYVDISGSVQNFATTAAPQQSTWQQYLNDYGMPNVSGLGLSLRQSGTYSDRDDKWYSVNTGNNKRQIAIHTYTTGSPSSSETLNYVVLYDETKYAPVWTAHTMNSYYWPDNNAGRNDSWTDDPAINLTQQEGLDNASTVGYSRGHLVASDYRQTNVKQNKQTFYHSNQAPQWQNSFNSGFWSTLEGRVKTMTPSGTTTMLYVVTGVLYEGTVSNNVVTSSTVPTKSSGSLNVPIPSHFYKCIMKCTLNGSGVPTSAQGIAFIYTNEAHTTGNYYDSTYVTSIDAIETRAGFDFFANVPSSVQTAAESNTNHYWFTGQGSPNSISSVTGSNWGSF